MKYIKFYKIGLLLVLLSTMACNDDFLDLGPEDAASDENFFTRASDFENFVNFLYIPTNDDGEYNGIIRENSQSGLFANLAVNTDDVLRNTTFGGLQELNNSSIADQTNNVWNTNYTSIRAVNYMLSNIDKLETSDAFSDHYIGEGYFMRAFFYFDLLQTFGGVPYIDEALGTTSEDLYKPRDSRDFIATKIIEDLDKAIDLLQEKGVGAAVLGRVNKQAALLLKTRVGLYEGSWERYHGQKGSPFAVAGSDGTAFLNAAVDAGNALIAIQGNTIFKGPSGSEYSNLFNDDNGGSLEGVFLFRDYSVDLAVLGNRPRTLALDNASLTKTAVDSYLMSDGLPPEISTVTASVDIANQNSVINSRDPRLRQTLYAPDRGQRQDVLGGLMVENVQGIYRPAIVAGIRSTGYYIWKGTPLSTVSIDFNDIDDVIYRYAEALLNFAEAKAILGTITQADINNSVNILRDRVGAVDMNLGQVNGWSVTYSANDGYDPTAPNIVNEIRRERHMELILEGFRNDDLKRWAVYEDVINGYIPVSAHYQELVDFYSDDQNLIDAGYATGAWNNVRYREGINSGQINGYLTPFFQDSDFNSAGSQGYYINPDRDYLESIPQVEIDLYRERESVELTQNPGWI